MAKMLGNKILTVKAYFWVSLSAFILCILIPSAKAEYLADGFTLIPLTNDGRSAAISWAYHGDLIAFVKEESSTQKQLLIMKSDGSSRQAVTQIGNPFFVEWSWSGKKLSYEFSNAVDRESQAGVYIYDVESDKSISISAPYPRSSLDENDGPFWSPDEKYVAYNVRIGPSVRRGPSRTHQLWVADVQSGKHWQILPERGRIMEQGWSFSLPPRLCVKIEASLGGFDVATVDPDGRNLILLTDIGAQSVWTNSPRFSPTEEWIAFTSNIDMTQTERDLRRDDCWLARPDGTEARNLTNATSPSTEQQLDINNLYWSWDGQWMLAEGNRFDSQGNRIPTCYMIDPINGGYEPILTSEPDRTSEINGIFSTKISHDSSKIAFLIWRRTVRNWPSTPQFENPRSVLSIYDVKEKKIEDILIYEEQLDRKEISASSRRRWVEDISWSPDNRSILLTISDIISDTDHVRQPDVYRLDLPERYIADSASEHIGPPIGRSVTPAQIIAEDVSQTIDEQEEEISHIDRPGFITQTINPLHMTVEEAAASLSAEYDEYFTTNPVRNVFLFKGPPEILAAFKSDLQLIDSPSPHILVDMLAVELSDEANRILGLDWTYAEGHFALFQPQARAIQKYPHTVTTEDYMVGFPSGALDNLNTLSGVGQSFYQGVGQVPSEFFIRLNTLVEDGKGTILANPRTVAMSGKESLIQIRKTLNYFFNEGFDVSGRPIVKKSDITADTEGRITPTLLSDGRIHLKVDVKVGNFTFTPDAGLPELTTRQSTTEVDVQQGETLVLGGLRQQEMSNSVTKIPILGDLPLLGPLFRHEEKSVKQSVLTILITPKLMQPGKPAPDWPVLDSNDYKIVPIMKDSGQLEMD
ncbi:hypothetical protein ACFL1G_05235 [Planctomycetota bacterium]